MIPVNENLLFVGGDISGIQKFIYNISSKKAMVSLKGRSTYLSEYTDSLCQGIAFLPEVTTVDIIYCSGGKFYMIVKDTQPCRKSIEDYYHKSEKALWNEHKGQLGLSIAYVPFKMLNENCIEIGNEKFNSIGELWWQISAKFATMKNRKFSNALISDFNVFFEVLQVGGETKVCAITGIEDRNCVSIRDNDEELWVLPSVRNQIEIGQRLRDKESFKNLEEYADGSYLGILRMDVDGLGARFVKGFDNFDSYKAFSDKISVFFKQTLFTIKEEYKEYINIVYAGGDDLFALGRWDKIIDFAEKVHGRFMNDMRGENISISGGMTVTAPKFPIAKSSEMAGQAEDEAKHYNNNQKNAFSFLGESVGWEDEFNKVKQTKNELISHINNNNVPRGILHQLMFYSSQAIDGSDNSYLWHEVYYLSRLLERIGKDNPATDYITELKNTIPTRTKNDYRLIGLSARWAELILRMETNLMN